MERLVAATAGHEVYQVDPARYADVNTVKRSWWPSVDIHTPVIFVPHPQTQSMVLVDGRHRVYKAWRQGRASVPAIYLSVEEERGARLTAEEWERLSAPDLRAK